MKTWSHFLGESTLSIALIVLIISRCVDRVVYTYGYCFNVYDNGYRRITYEYSPFLWYFANIICPIAFVLTSWPVVWYKMWFTGEITPEMKAFPTSRFAVMALLDTLCTLMAAFPVPHIGGNLANVLGQVNLPFNMIMSACFLQTKYRRIHVLGAILVVYGSLVDMIPIILGTDVQNSPDPSPFWICMYIFAMVPSAASNIYKEIALKDVDLDIWYTNAWISVYQVGWGILTMWTIQFPAFCDPPIEWSSFPHYLAAGHNCFIGNDVVLNDHPIPCNNGVLTQFLLFILFNLVYNQLMLYVFKEGSSVLFVISSAICLPLTDVLYMFPIITGNKATQSFTLYDAFALFVLVIGILVYHSEKETRLDPTGTKSIEKSPMLSSPSFQKTQMMRAKRGRILYHQSPVTFRQRVSPSRPLLSLRNPVTYGSTTNNTNIV
ncbi:Drug/Metabolite Transporter (DMT) Superfamily [Thraustotheca clavata]|uniref:Drug/Metabolite Transporter (DMT) Superfamily n=1 Tax=Thraustotheca clavata TaxID=74557 RepID=A0A1W0A9B5_9STRA|nr:Drug/Metabolite Transporter (DMT) Superfamily [Thraustotheca clavata]